MVRSGGLEPPTSGATILRSNQLSYNRTFLEWLHILGVTYEGRDIFASPSVTFSNLATTMPGRSSAVCSAGNRRAGMIPALHAYFSYAIR